jgi:Zn-finger nucleic acid-binding protein
MDEVPVPATPGEPRSRAEIDRCARCGGVFLEFFDGEPSALSRGLEGRTELAPAGGAAADGELACPDCGAVMVRAPYLGHGPALPRCGSCLAVFLTPAQREALAALALPPEPPREEPSWLERLVGWVREL